MKKLAQLCLAFAVLALSACANMDNFRRAVPGQATGAEVMSIYGKPTRIWDDADGGKTLEYSYQPYGQACYMIKLDRNDKVVSRENTLDSAGLARIENGMTQEQVSRILGRERSRMYFDRMNEDVWDWTVDGGGSGYIIRFNVHFKDGKVARTSRSMVDPREFRMGL